MKKNLSFLLTILLSWPLTLTNGAAQTSGQQSSWGSRRTLRAKLAPDLNALLDQDDEEQRSGSNRAQQRLHRLTRTPRPALKGAAVPALEVPADAPQSFIVQVAPTTPEILWQEKLAASGGRLTRNYASLGLAKIEATRTAIRALVAAEEIEYVSPDRVTKTLGHVETTTGAAAATASTSTSNFSNFGPNHSSHTNAALDGTGVGIAVLDSGIDEQHWAFLGKENKDRVTAIDYKNAELPVDKNDPYGHGTHVASLAAGNINQQFFPSRLRGDYDGIAPGASLYSLRVLDEEGFGKTSWLIAALEWVQKNHDKVTPHIRVVNLSLGTAAVDSYKNDPLCRAVRRLTARGLIVVASAGNDGKDSEGNKVYGLIHAPANDPSVITVGASNTFGTDSRADDVVTTYSSRGPTRSYWTDNAGNKHYDNLLKPDLVAPGNKLISAKSRTSHTHLATENPQLVTYEAGARGLALMRLSGTSMSAPIVAGAAALMLQANPKLTPNLVKVLLMYTAQSLAGFNQLEQGAGQLNIEGAVRLAKLVRTDLNGKLGEDLLTTNALPSPRTTIAGHTFPWAQGVILGPTYATGTALITKYQVVYGQGMLLSDGVALADGMLLSDALKLTKGIKLGAELLTSSGMLMSDGLPVLNIEQLLGDGMLLSDGIALADGMLMSDGMLLGDGIALADGIMLADGMLMADYLRAKNIQVNGDSTTAQE
jgi:subtilisin family serine protease